MKPVQLHVIAMLVAAALVDGQAQAQARGPSADEILEHGQDIVSSREEARQRAMEMARAQKEQADREEAELRDPLVRARKLAELDAWFKRLPGRFRIDGNIELPGSPTGVPPAQRGTVSGVADCASVGDGIGVQCIINATWHDISANVANIGAMLSPAEMLKTFNPAVLIIGLNPDPPGIRALMVNADSLAHIWVGKLRENTAQARRLNRCLYARCIQPLEVVAEPESDTVTIELRTGVILTLTMYRDPEARAEKPMKALKAR